MTEILTESFCERCGTRYTFESARPRVRLKGVKVLSRGLKNFVMSDDSSIDEAMAAARSDTDRELTAHQLDAFHKTFNFCMSCRQYTCPNCWNEAEARCLTCAPHLGHEVLPAPFPDLVTSSYLVADPPDAAVTNGANGSNGTAHDTVTGDANAESVDTADFAARLQALMSPPPLEEPVEAVIPPVDAAVEIEDVAQTEPVADIAIAPRSAIAPAVEAAAISAEAEPSVEPVMEEVEPVAADDSAGDADSDGAAEIAARLAAWSAAAAVMDARDEESATKPSTGEKGAAQTGGLLRRFRAGQDPDAELDDYEREQATTAPVAGQPEPEMVAEAEVVAEPEVVPEPEVVAEVVVAAQIAEVEVAAEPEPAAEPEMIAAEPVVEAVAEPEPEVAAEPVVEAVAEPVAEVVEPEPVAEVVAEPVVAAEPDVAAEPEVAATAPEPAAPEPAVDVIPQPTWRTYAPDPTLETPPAAPSLPAAATLADPNAEPQWPTRPEWPGGVAPAVGLPFLNRPPAPTGGLEALWAESAREVVAPQAIPGRPVPSAIQPCVSCGLSLSATARFCRRCGTPQAV